MQVIVVGIYVLERGPHELCDDINTPVLDEGAFARRSSPPNRDKDVLHADWICRNVNRSWNERALNLLKSIADTDMICMSAEEGRVEALYAIGACYHRGTGVPQDDAEAVKWYRKAAEHGNSMGQCHLGECLFRGEGVPQNKEEAIGLYRKSAESP